MSQRDLVAELRGRASPRPPSCAHTFVRSQPARPRRGNRFTWRRALVVALPAAAAIAAVLVVTRPDNNQTAVSARRPGNRARREVTRRASDRSAGSVGSGATRLAPVHTGRVQQYGAYLALRVPTPDGVSDGVKRALRIASSLGGYPTSVTRARTRKPHRPT